MHPMYAVTFALKTRGEFPILQDLKEFAHFTALGANFTLLERTILRGGRGANF